MEFIKGCICGWLITSLVYIFIFSILLGGKKHYEND